MDRDSTQPNRLASEFDVEFDDGLPPSVDRAAVRRMRLVATLLDESIRVPVIGYRIGIDPVLGIVPGAGDVVAGALSMYIVAESARLGVSYPTLLRMLANVSLDFVGGSVPVVGSFFDAIWKANKRNVALFVSDVSTREVSTGDLDGTSIEVESDYGRDEL